MLARLGPMALPSLTEEWTNEWAGSLDLVLNTAAVGGLSDITFA